MPERCQPRFGGTVDAPVRVELRPELVVLDVLEAGQPVGQGAHVAAALDVVLAAQRVEAAAVAPDVAGQQREADQGQDVVDRVVVLGDPEGPADHRPVGRREGVGQLADRLGRDAGLALGVLEGVRLDLRPVGLEAGRGALDELAVLEAGGDDLAADRVGQRDVGADVEPEPEVGPLARSDVRRGSTAIEPGAPVRRRAGGGGRRSGASRGRCCPTGRSDPSPRPHGMNLCRHRHRTRSPDRRRSGRVRCGCSCRCCCCPGRPG